MTTTLTVNDYKRISKRNAELENLLGAAHSRNGILEAQMKNMICGQCGSRLKVDSNASLPKSASVSNKRKPQLGPRITVIL